MSIRTQFHPMGASPIQYTNGIVFEVNIPSAQYVLCLPAISTGYQASPIYNELTFDFGDGTIVKHEAVSTGYISARKNTYAEPGTYIIKITGDISYATIDSWLVSRANLITSMKKILFVNIFSNIKDGGSNKGLFNFAHNCTALTSIPKKLSGNILSLKNCFSGCTALTSKIPPWPDNVTDVSNCYNGCSSLLGCSDELLLNPMPNHITSHTNAVAGCPDSVRQYFTSDWGGTKA